MKFSAAFEEKVARSESQEDRPLVSSYLNPPKIDAKKPARFALLEEDPFIFYAVWCKEVSSDKNLKMRFSSKPSEKEVFTALGKEYSWGTKWQSDERAPVKETYAWPIYDYDNKMVRILEIDQFTIANAFRRLAGNKKYTPNLTFWDLSLYRVVTDGRTTYDLQVEPRDDEAEEAMEAAWKETQKKGFNLQELITNGDPFNPGGEG